MYRFALNHIQRACPVSVTRAQFSEIHLLSQICILNSEIIVVYLYY